MGIGGGSSLDIAKGLSILSHNEGSISDFSGVNRVPRRGLPLLLVPTTAGTGSEVTNVAVYSDDNHTKFGVVTPHNIPDIAVIDPELSIGLPPEQTAITGLDALSHALESFVGRNNSFFSEPYALAAINDVANFLLRAYRNGADIEARERMMRASMFAGIAFTNTQTGGAHGCGMALGIAAQLPHGLAVTLMLPAVIRFNIPKATERYARAAHILDPQTCSLPDEVAAEQCATVIEKLTQDLGIQMGLRNYGVTDKHIAEIAAAAFKNTRIWVNNPREPSLHDIEMIVQQSM